MSSQYRAKDDLFLNTTDELEVFIPSKSTQSYRLTLLTFILFMTRMDLLTDAKCEL